MTQYIGQYQLIEELAPGGMGVVYRAFDTQLQREVALKRLRPEVATSPRVLDRFRNEAKLQGRLNHPNIAQLYTLVQTDDAFGIVMEFVDGVMVKNLLPMRWELALCVMRQTLEAIGFAHNQGVLHRDIKPENILIDRRGVVKVMDFGIAYALGSERMTREKSIVGTLEFMSPERIQGHPMDGRSDIYSLGILLFELISGQLPFHAESEYELLRCQIEQEPPRLSSLAEVPAHLDDVIRRAMQKEPAARYVSCLEMAEDFASLASQLDGPAELQAVVNQSRAGQQAPFDETRCFAEAAAKIATGNLSSSEQLLRAQLSGYPRQASLRQFHAVVARACELSNASGNHDQDELRTWLQLIGTGRTGDETAQRDAFRRMALACPDSPIFHILAARLEGPGEVARPQEHKR